jgi:enoyl-CoA hydratase/carnithine racemase
MSDADELVREQHGAVLVLRLNRPQARNALTPALLVALGEAVLLAESDPGIRAMVLTGTGDRAFCAGMDLRAFSDSGRAGGRDDEAGAASGRLFRGTVGVPVVGAANATAVGGGLELLLGSDVIVASDQARFGFPEVKRGLFAAGGGTFLGTRVPLGVALEMTLTGDLVDAARAREIGLVNAVVPADEVLATALGYAERIAANAPLGLAATKELVRLGVSDHARATTRLKELQVSVFGSADAKEGAAAFVEKRTPVWQGR